MTASITIDETSQFTAVCGCHDTHIKRIEALCGLEIFAKGTTLTLRGETGSVHSARGILEELLALTRSDVLLDEYKVEQLIQRKLEDPAYPGGKTLSKKIKIPRNGRHIVPKNPAQAEYIEKMETHDITFTAGPAGTGKSYLAVALGVFYLVTERYERLILTRPVVEAGESLGFLPGDFEAKISPYMRPLYDALNHMLPYEAIKRYDEEDRIEVAPLAYMRGRTLSNAFIILDEAQNTTVAQMKMFLSRLGENSKMVITGDITQIDLPKNTQSGLVHALSILAGISGIALQEFDRRDVVRHPLVRDVLAAYESGKA
ncbi:MAG: PhoH family protein [Spirochaetota bacterium]